MVTKSLDFSAFGKNDIRGIYSENITEELFYYTGKGFVAYVAEQSGLNPQNMLITVARDARLSSESLAKVLIKGIMHAGANVINLDVVPTPLGYFSEFASLPDDITDGLKVNASLVVTASHNPPEYNGLKMTYNKSSLDENQIKRVKELTMYSSEADITAVKHGQSRLYNIVNNYSDFIIERFNGTGKGIKIVTDCANGTAGVVAPKLYKDTGCEVVELYTEPDGTFPNHHPNPSDYTTLKTLQKAVVENNADLGIAFDGDSDRIGVVDSEGKILSGDKLLYLYAVDVLKDLTARGEKPAIVSEVKCSQVLFDEIEKLGGYPVMAKTGHGYIKSKMKETGSILAGEMSGHMFFKDRYYGFDDAVYAGCRIIEIVAKNKMSQPDFKLSDMLAPFKKVHTLDEIRYECPNDLKKIVLNALTEKIENDKNIFGNEISSIVKLDGLRIIFPDGFALIRQSNTEPVFTLRFEAKTKKSATQYRDVMLSMLDEEIKKHK